MKRIFFAFALFCILVSCKKEPQAVGLLRPPAMLFVLIDRQGMPLITSTATPLRVSSTNAKGTYFELGQECAGGGCQMINSFQPAQYRPYDFFYASGDLSDASNNGSKQWLLTLNGKTDTLYYDVQPPSGNLSYHVVGASFNGVPVQLDQRLSPAAYVLQRRH
jgi:hypothetical protein